MGLYICKLLSPFYNLVFNIELVWVGCRCERGASDVEQPLTLDVQVTLGQNLQEISE